jgi:hypothetical protein
VFLEVLPNLFDRIEFRCISRKPLNVQTWMLSSEFRNNRAFMNASIVPNENDIAFQVTEETAEESSYTGSIEVVFLKADVESHAFSHSRDT